MNIIRKPEELESLVGCVLRGLNLRHRFLTVQP
jgi:hypothetical protein